jgi:hypothetical protein
MAVFGVRTGELAVAVPASVATVGCAGVLRVIKAAPHTEVTVGLLLIPFGRGCGTVFGEGSGTAVSGCDSRHHHSGLESLILHANGFESSFHTSDRVELRDQLAAADIVEGRLDALLVPAAAPTMTFWLTNTRATAWLGFADTDVTAGICFCVATRYGDGNNRSLHIVAGLWNLNTNNQLRVSCYLSLF